jgi:AcrR family transcriptional regulator
MAQLNPPSGSHRPARPRSRRGEGDQLRVDLLDAAADLMAEKGELEAISLRSIAARAGVSPTAVYRHFDDHVHLLREAVEQCWSQFAQHLIDAVTTQDDPYQRLRAAGDAYVGFALSEPGKYRVLFSNRIDLEMEPIKAGGVAFELLVDLVANVLAANGDDRDPRLVAVLTHTWIHGIVDLCGNHHHDDWPDVATMLDHLSRRLGFDRPA